MTLPPQSESDLEAFLSVMSVELCSCLIAVLTTMEDLWESMSSEC